MAHQRRKRGASLIQKVKHPQQEAEEEKTRARESDNRDRVIRVTKEKEMEEIKGETRRGEVNL